MALPTPTTALHGYYGDLLFTGAYLNATKGLAPLGKKVLDLRKKLQAAVAARNAANDELVLASVSQSIAWSGVAGPLESFERQVAAHFDADRAAYAKVFPFTPKAMLRGSETLRPKLFAAPLAFAKKSGLSGKLGETAKELQTSWNEYLAAAEASKEASKAQTAAVAAVALAKHHGVVAMRETEGALRAKYAEEPSQWKRFFRAKKGKAAEKKEPSDGGGTGSGPAPEDEKKKGSKK